MAQSCVRRETVTSRLSDDVLGRGVFGFLTVDVVLRACCRVSRRWRDVSDAWRLSLTSRCLLAASHSVAAIVHVDLLDDTDAEALVSTPVSTPTGRVAPSSSGGPCRDVVGEQGTVLAISFDEDTGDLIALCHLFSDRGRSLIFRRSCSAAYPTTHVWFLDQSGSPAPMLCSPTTASTSSAEVDRREGRSGGNGNGPPADDPPMPFSHAVRGTVADTLRSIMGSGRQPEQREGAGGGSGGRLGRAVTSSSSALWARTLRSMQAINPFGSQRGGGGFMGTAWLSGHLVIDSVTLFIWNVRSGHGWSIVEAQRQYLRRRPVGDTWRTIPNAADAIPATPAPSPGTTRGDATKPQHVAVCRDSGIVVVLEEIEEDKAEGWCTLPLWVLDDEGAVCRRVTLRVDAAETSSPTTAPPTSSSPLDLPTPTRAMALPRPLHKSSSVAVVHVWANGCVHPLGPRSNDEGAAAVGVRRWFGGCAQADGADDGGKGRRAASVEAGGGLAREGIIVVVRLRRVCIHHHTPDSMSTEQDSLEAFFVSCAATGGGNGGGVESRCSSHIVEAARAVALPRHRRTRMGFAGGALGRVPRPITADFRDAVWIGLLHPTASVMEHFDLGRCAEATPAPDGIMLRWDLRSLLVEPTFVTGKPANTPTPQPCASAACAVKSQLTAVKFRLRSTAPILSSTSTRESVASPPCVFRDCVIVRADECCVVVASHERPAAAGGGTIPAALRRGVADAARSQETRDEEESLVMIAMDGSVVRRMPLRGSHVRAAVHPTLPVIASIPKDDMSLMTYHELIPMIQPGVADVLVLSPRDDDHGVPPAYHHPHPSATTAAVAMLRRRQQASLTDAMMAALSPRRSVVTKEEEEEEETVVRAGVTPLVECTATEPSFASKRAKKRLNAGELHLADERPVNSLHAAVASTTGGPLEPLHRTPESLAGDQVTRRMLGIAEFVSTCSFVATLLSLLAILITLLVGTQSPSSQSSLAVT